MNRISIHPASALLGLVFGVLVLLSMSQVSPLNTKSVVVQYGPNPRDMVQIREGTPYVVPSGRLLAVTALGSIGSNVSEAHLYIDGQEELSAGLGSTSAACRTVPVPSGMTIPPGSTVTVTGSFSNGRAWGYLAPQ